MQCECHSGLPYSECCGDYHSGKQLPESALILMRSRFSAYARNQFDYIIETTHPENPSYRLDRDQWRESIKIFCLNTDFKGLKILEFVEGNKEAFVTFYAHLLQKGDDASFIENSHFVKMGNKWLYYFGHTEKP